MAASFCAACAIVCDPVPWMGSMCCCPFAKKLFSPDVTKFVGAPNWDFPPPRQTSHRRKGASDHPHCTLRRRWNCAKSAFRRNREPVIPIEISPLCSLDCAKGASYVGHNCVSAGPFRRYSRVWAEAERNGFRHAACQLFFTGRLL